MMTNKRQRRSSLVPAANLIAIGEIMLILWITSLVAGMSAQMQLHETAFGSRTHEEPPSFQHAVVVGPGTELFLDGEAVDLDAMVGALHGKDGVELRAHPAVDPSGFFEARYRLRAAGIGYTEKPPLKGKTQE